MCGIVALVSIDGRPLDDALGKGQVETKLDQSLEKIKHRGPDGKGIWVSEDRQIALGHCRLSINDLSSSGDQPLHSPDDSLHAIVNGEIYDYPHLSSLLSEQGYKFQGHSDSELVLALYQHFGINFLSYLRGEYVLCLYDERTKTVIVARDRYGIKPIFWREHEKKGVSMFGAEMKAFLPFDWKPEWDVEGLMDGGWGQDTRTVFKGVQKLRPGYYMMIKDGTTEIRPYWDAQYPDKRLPDPRSEGEMILQTRELLVEAVQQRLRADVPVGIYLSGGIDSSAIAGIASHLVKTKGITMGCQDPKERICCFSIAFDEDSGFNESAISEETSKFLDVRFLKKHMDEKELAKDFEEAIYHCEHHTHDLNTVGKYSLSELPRKYGYKVVLTGEGADEHFGGYPLFLPEFLSDQNGHDMKEEDRLNLYEEQTGIAKKTYDITGADSKYFDQIPNSRYLPLTTPSAMLSFTPPLSIFSSEARQIYPAIDPLTTITNNIPPSIQSDIQDKWHPLNSGMYTWCKGHLANQLLSCLGDRVEMAHSVEARTPFLDHKLTKYVNDLPINMKIKYDGNGGFVEKYILREAMKPFITEEVYKRRKHPYTAPTTYPLQGPVHLLLERLITKERIEKLGFIDWKEMERLKVAAYHDSPDVWAWRRILIVACWTVLSERFQVETWTP